MFIVYLWSINSNISKNLKTSQMQLFDYQNLDKNHNSRFIIIQGKERRFHLYDTIKQQFKELHNS